MFDKFSGRIFGEILERNKFGLRELELKNNSLEVMGFMSIIEGIYKGKSVMKTLNLFDNKIDFRFLSLENALVVAQRLSFITSLELSSNNL